MLYYAPRYKKEKGVCSLNRKPAGKKIGNGAIAYSFAVGGRQQSQAIAAKWLRECMHGVATAHTKHRVYQS